MNKIQKMAAKDAYDYGLALMFFGEGAGNRRKLITAEIAHKVENLSGYHEAFEAAFARLNQMEMAEKALAERKRIDAANKTRKNINALKNGNLRGLTNGVFVVVGVGYVAHITGYDKVAYEEGKKLYKKAKLEFRYRKAKWQGTNITVVR